MQPLRRLHAALLLRGTLINDVWACSVVLQNLTQEGGDEQA